MLTACAFGLFMTARFLSREPEPEPPIETSCYFERYKTRQDVTVAFFKDKKISDSSTIDVTVIEAVDFSAWYWIVREFQGADAHDNDLLLQQMCFGKKRMAVCMIEPGRVGIKCMDSQGSKDVVAINYENKTCYIFNTPTKEQQYYIVAQLLINESPERAKYSIYSKYLKLK